MSAPPKCAADNSASDEGRQGRPRRGAAFPNADEAQVEADKTGKDDVKDDSALPQRDKPAVDRSKAAVAWMRERRTLVRGLVGAVVLVAGWMLLSATGVWRSSSGEDALQNLRDATGVGAVPVVAAFVHQREVPIYRIGLGSVQAFNTVTLTSRVDGQLLSLAFKEGQEVKKGDVLAQIDPRPFEAALRQAEAAQRSNAAKLVAAKADLDRASELQKTQAGTRQQLDNRRAEVDQLQAAVDGAQAEIDKARLQLDYSTIRSPIDGRTGLRLIDAGNMILSIDRTPIVTVTQLEPISVVFSLPQEDLNEVVHQMAKAAAKGDHLDVAAIGRDNREEIERGELTTIDNQIDQKTGTFKLKATFDNAKRLLWPGQFVTVRLLLRTEEKGLVLPAPALQRGPDGSFVFVITPDETVRMQSVSVSQIQDGVALIESGLTAGERVVVDGQYRLRPGSKISVTRSERPTLAGDLPRQASPAGMRP